MRLPMLAAHVISQEIVTVMTSCCVVGLELNKDVFANIVTKWSQLARRLWW